MDKNDPKQRKRSANEDLENADSGDNGEYGVEQILAPEEVLEEVRKRSSYHFSQKELEHKEDRLR